MFRLIILSLIATASVSASVEAQQATEVPTVSDHYLCHTSTGDERRVHITGKRLFASQLPLLHEDAAIEPYFGDNLDIRQMAKAFSELSGYNILIASRVGSRSFSIAPPGPNTISALRDAFFEQLERLDLVAVKTVGYLRISNPCAQIE